MSRRYARIIVGRVIFYLQSIRRIAFISQFVGTLSRRGMNLAFIQDAGVKRLSSLYLRDGC